MTKNIKRLRAMLRRVPVLIRDDDSLLKLWVDERDQSEWARHVATVEDDDIAAWVTDGPAIARAVADDCERAKAESADLRARLEAARRSCDFSRDRHRELVTEIDSALNDAGFERGEDSEGEIEPLADVLRRALKGQG